MDFSQYMAVSCRKTLAVDGFGLIAGAIVGKVGRDLRIVVLARLHIGVGDEEAYRHILLGIHMERDRIAFRRSAGGTVTAFFSAKRQGRINPAGKGGPRTRARCWHERRTTARCETVVEPHTDGVAGIVTRAIIRTVALRFCLGEALLRSAPGCHPSSGWRLRRPTRKRARPVQSRTPSWIVRVCPPNVYDVSACAPARARPRPSTLTLPRKFRLVSTASSNRPRRSDVCRVRSPWMMRPSFLPLLSMIHSPPEPTGIDIAGHIDLHAVGTPLRGRSNRRRRDLSVWREPRWQESRP